MNKTGSDRSMPRSITRLASTTNSSSHHNVRIPIRIEDCAHFHYDKVELALISVTLYTQASGVASLPTTPTTTTLIDQHQHNTTNQRTPHQYCGISPETDEFFFTALVQSRGQSWLIRRTYTQLKNFDKMLHQCAWDRHVSRLEPPPSIMELSQIKKDVDEYKSFVHAYLGKLTALTGGSSGSGGFSANNQQFYPYQSDSSTGTGNVACNLITCGPVLNFLEMDNRGNRLIPFCHDSEINTPAIAAVHVTRAREPDAKDELQLEVGDIISVIDMPPPKESSWWRGKRGLEVGYFPADCVQVISVSHTPRGGGNTLTMKNRAGNAAASSALRGVGVVSLEEAQKRQPAVLKSRNKLSAVLRNFFAHQRPPRGLLRQAGLLQERVFGCDLAEHVDRLATRDAENRQKVPVVVLACCQFVELHCLHSDGVYRRSGVQSNIQKLRQEFDNVDNYYKTDADVAEITIACAPFLDREQFRTDIHCVPSVLKQYFRELPNPLLTHQLYHAFLRVTRCEDEAERVELLRDTVKLLPPPHYQTLKFLMRHLHRLATEHAVQTSMNEKNLARVWGPNLLRKPEQGSLLDATTKLLPTETSDVTGAAAAAVQIMGSKGGRIAGGGGISSPMSTSTVKSSSGSGGGGTAAETANLQMMTEVVQGAVIVELMIRQYSVVFEQQQANEDENVDPDAEEEKFVNEAGGDFSLDAASFNNNDMSHYGTTDSSKTPFRISFRRQQQQQQQQKQQQIAGGANSKTAAELTSASGAKATTAHRGVPSSSAAAASSAGLQTNNGSKQRSTATSTAKVDSDQARRNKTISMLQTEEFYPHFAAGVKLIPLQDAAESIRNSTANLSSKSTTTPVVMTTVKSNTLPTVRPPSSIASSSYSRDFSDCDDNDDVEDEFPAVAAVVQRRERRHNGKSPERAPSSASRKSTKSTGSQLAASVKSKLKKWPFSGRHKKSEADEEEKPSSLYNVVDCPLIDASPSISLSEAKKTNVQHRHERKMSADAFCYSMPTSTMHARNTAAARTMSNDEDDEFYADENDDAVAAAPPVYANLASLAAAAAAASKQHNSVPNSTSSSNTKRLSTFSSSNVHIPQQQQQASSTLTTRTLPSAVSVGGGVHQQPLYANNTMIIDALKKRNHNILQQKKQSMADDAPSEQQQEVVRLRPCSHKFSNAGALLTFDVVATTAAASSSSTKTIQNDQELNDDVISSATSASSWATQSLPARARARAKKA